MSMNEQQRVENRQLTMKKEKKSNQRLKSKFPSANNAMAKARAFFRSFDFKHRHERSPSSTTIETPSSNDEPPQKDLLLTSISPTTTISISKIPRVEKINPRDLIIHRMADTNDRISSNYFQQKYKQYLKPTLLLPRQYYNDLINKRNYSTFINRYDFYSHSLNPHYRYSSGYNDPLYRPLISPQIKFSSNELRPPVPLILQSSSSSSISTWNQCVRRLNTEYRLTIDALEHAKECLKQVSINTKSHIEPRKFPNVTFRLPSPPSLSKYSIEQNQIFPSIIFSKPKLIKPLELETFKVESELIIIENDEKIDSIANIIKKFNDLSRSSSPIQKKSLACDSSINTTPRVHFKPSITTYEIPNLSSSSSELQEEEEEEEEETTYTIETFYTKTTEQNIVVVQEKTTEEQFNLVQPNPVPLASSPTPTPIDSTDNPSSSSSSTSVKKSISQIPKRIPTNTATISRLKPSSSSSKLKPPSTTTTVNNTIRKPLNKTSKQLSIDTPRSSKDSLQFDRSVRIKPNPSIKRPSRLPSLQSTSSTKIPRK